MKAHPHDCWECCGRGWVTAPEAGTTYADHYRVDGTTLTVTASATCSRCKGSGVESVGR